MVKQSTGHAEHGHGHEKAQHEGGNPIPEKHEPWESHLDYSKKHPIYNIELEKKGPEFSKIDDLREEYIKNFAGKIKLVPPVPKDIPGLVPLKSKLPVTRKWWRASSSFERNGMFNIHTKTFNTRIGFPFFFFFLVVGWYEPPILARHFELYFDNGELSDIVYDKMCVRILPSTKIWLRPA